MIHGIFVDFALTLYSSILPEENLHRSILVGNILYMSKIDTLIGEKSE